MKISKLVIGALMMAGSLFMLFNVDATMLDDFVSFGTIQSIGVVSIIVGIVGLSIFFNGLNQR